MWQYIVLHCWTKLTVGPHQRKPLVTANLDAQCNSWCTDNSLKALKAQLYGPAKRKINCKTVALILSFEWQTIQYKTHCKDLQRTNEHLNETNTSNVLQTTRRQWNVKTGWNIIPNWLTVSLTRHMHVRVNRQTCRQSSRTHLQQRTQCCDVDRCRQFVAVQRACSTLHIQHQTLRKTAPTYCRNSLCPHELPPLDSAARFYAASSLHADNIKQTINT